MVPPNSYFGFQFQGPRYLDLDPNGDVAGQLRDGSTARLSSKVLSLASPVFAAMLCPTFSEGKQLKETGSPELNLRDDDPKAMGIILKILHFQNHLVPGFLTVTPLYNIAIIVDKYDLLNPLLPWKQMWLAQLDCPEVNTVEDGMWLAISWIFKERSIFSSITRRLLLECTLDKSGRMVAKGGKRFGEGVPDRVLGALKSKRYELVDKLATGLLAEIAKYKLAIIDGTAVCAKVGPASTNALISRKHCDAMSLGTLTRCLIAAGLDADSVQDRDNYSLEKVFDALKQMENFGDQLQLKYISAGYPRSTEGTHSTCGSHGTITALANIVEKLVVGLSISNF